MGDPRECRGRRQAALEQTLRGFGLRIERISMFQFLSPEYEELLQRRGQIGLRNKAFKDRQETARLNEEEGKIEPPNGSASRYRRA